VSDQDLLLDDPDLRFGSGVIGVCDICGKRQAVVTLQQERYKVCVLDFLNKTWKNSTLTPGRPLPAYRSERIWFDAPSMPGGKAQAIVLTPTKISRHPAVLVTTDVYGLTTMVLDAGLRFARAGFEVLMPDLPKSRATTAGDHAALRADVLLRGGVRVGAERLRRVVEMYGDALRHLRGRPMVDPQKVGVFGASYGGALAIAVAGADRSLAAVALAFPPPVLPAEYPKLINAPVLFVAGDRDAKANRAKAQWEAAASAGTTSVEFLSRPGRDHLFLARDSRAYSLPDAEAAWTRIVDFLGANLLPPPPRPPAPPIVKVPPPAPVSAAPIGPAPATPRGPAESRPPTPATPRPG
jgi:carboxymethylenebutenolidase